MTIRAAGAVVWRPGVEVLVVHRPRYDDWSLPKGKVHEGEEPLLAARREVLEETGCAVALGPYLCRTHYRVDGDEKSVDYWAARAGSTRPHEADDEVDEVAWLPVDAAYDRVSWDTDREVLARFRRLPLPEATVLLVRHAHAGSADEWDGDDDLRPLSAKGVAQVAWLREVLPAFWLERPAVRSAPLVRCVDTVSWAGEVEPEPRLAGIAWERDAALPVACVRALAEDAAARAGVVVAGSQGGVVATIVETLRAEDGLPPGQVKERKGSAWVLSFAGGRLVAADYLDARE